MVSQCNVCHQNSQNATQITTQLAILEFNAHFSKNDVLKLLMSPMIEASTPITG